MSDGRSLGTFHADNVVDARHVDAAATALALLTVHALDGGHGKGGRKKKRDRLMVISSGCDTMWMTRAAKASRMVVAKISLLRNRYSVLLMPSRLMYLCHGG